MKATQRDISLDDLADGELGEPKKLHRTGLFFYNFAITIGIMTAVSVLSFLFRHIGFHESNIIVAYILGVLLVARQTDGYFYGILASVVGVLTFNFFFTEPYYTFLTYRPDYPVTFVIMLIAAIITSTLTAKAKYEARLSSLREKRIQILYRINKGLLKVRSIKQIEEVGAENIARLFIRSVIIATINLGEDLGEPYVFAFENNKSTDAFNSSIERQAIAEAFRIGNPVGAGTDLFAESSAYYLPIRGQSGILGVLGVSCSNKQPLSEEQKNLLEAVATLIALAVERERLWEIQQRSKMDVERERLRGNLLRSISHDLRTPLTGILGATATILENGDILEAKVKRELLQNVYEDASWLRHSVENILSMTRMDEGRMEIKKNTEAVEEIVAGAVSRIKKLAGEHRIKINIPNDLIMLPMDGTLIEQVLINLMDNALKYTPNGSIIEIRTHLEEEKAVFEVADNGMGIPEANIPFVFDRFYTTAEIKDTGRRGTGLGLAICKSIITAHGGEISVFNNSSGGATFRFVLPLKE